MDKQQRLVSESDRAEVMAFLAAMEGSAYQFPQLTHGGLSALRDVIGTGEMERLAGMGMTEADAYRYARVVARGVCALVLQARHNGGLDPLGIALNAMILGYERGVRDATDMELSPEAMRLLADKVEREEEGGREVERFRRELEGLE